MIVIQFEKLLIVEMSYLSVRSHKFYQGEVDLEVDMDLSVTKEGNTSIEIPENGIDESEVELATKASRAFAVSYMNEIYNTIKSIDPSIVKQVKATRRYPYSLHVFIQQEKPGRIEQLDLYTERKSTDHELCEVKEIYHSAHPWDPSIKDRMRNLADRGIRWRWSSLEIPEMYAMARSEGRRIGRYIYSHCAPIHPSMGQR